MTANPRDPQKPLAGLNILVVDDQFLVASLAEDILLEAGAGKAIIATDEAEAQSALDGPDRLDGVVLDINLDGRPAFDLARLLVKRRVPFVFVTGYGAEAPTPAELRTIGVVAKPYTPEMLVAPLLEAIRRGGG
jgi:DNA-binding LytR/AlgR family response regulator